MLVNMSGGKKVENIINEIVEPDLLWTNPSPTSVFNPQTVSVASGYDGYLIEILDYISHTPKSYSIGYVAVGSGAKGIGAPSYNSSSPAGGAMWRKINSANNGSIVFDRGVNESGYMYNGCGVPQRIWGVKFTL